ncbi:hypothetical protein J3Q64DRAFT_1362146 [Phycomyces blakesleeanus]|uniref:Ubiquitin-like domain-containing protein n=1 Tax=Phycomyces blakesleeanus TaxID=4837 RepID=A0ABR3ALJ9_PHYBL
MSETHNDAKRSNSRTSSTLPDAHHQVNVMALQIKSLEQRTHAVTVPRNASVLHLKSEIETVFAVDTGRQRLIFQGKVLKDDKQLADYANLDDGKVIHLVVRPVDAPQNPMNDEPRSQSSRRAFSRGLPRNLPPLSSRFPMMEGYTLITVDTSMGDMSEASSLISSVMSGISGIGPGYTGRSRPTTTNTATGGGANTTGGDHAGNRASAESRSGISSLNRWPFAFSLGQNPSDLPPASIAGAFESRTPAGIPFPSSVEVRLVRTMNSIRNVREMLEAPLSEEVPVNPVISNSSHEQTQHIRSRLQSGGNRQAAQVGVVVRELAELMELAVPQLNSMADALQEEGEEDNTEVSKDQSSKIIQ